MFSKMKYVARPQKTEKTITALDDKMHFCAQ